MTISAEGRTRGSGKDVVLSPEGDALGPLNVGAEEGTIKSICDVEGSEGGPISGRTLVRVGDMVGAIDVKESIWLFDDMLCVLFCPFGG